MPSPLQIAVTPVPDQIHLYAAVACARAVPDRRAGDRHPLLVFLRQPPGAAHDLAAAAAVAQAAGWTEVDITRAGILPPDAGEQAQGPYVEPYGAAWRDGAAMLVYDAVVAPAPVNGGGGA
jgi:hypothetical protein